MSISFLVYLQQESFERASHHLMRITPVPSVHAARPSDRLSASLTKLRRLVLKGIWPEV